MVHALSGFEVAPDGDHFVTTQVVSTPPTAPVTHIHLAHHTGLGDVLHSDAVGLLQKGQRERTDSITVLSRPCQAGAGSSLDPGHAAPGLRKSLEHRRIMARND
jgi:hypothetical protein